MHARILFTDGRRTRDLIWLEHSGTDVYWGHPRVDRHRSYHASGELHTKRGDQVSERSYVAPLQNLKGYFHLLTMGIARGASLDDIDSASEYRRRKADAIVTIDVRTFPEGVQPNLAVGLLEPGNFDAIKPLTLGRLDAARIEVQVQQLLLATSVNPWVAVTLHWVRVTSEPSTGP